MPSDLNTRLLASVSRSFYLSLRFVPDRLRHGLSVGYLLARATDTVADTAMAPGEKRLELLRLMEDVICGEKPSAALRETLCRRLREELAPGQDHAGERELLLRFSEMLEMYDLLPQDERGAVSKVLETIIRGQSLDLRRFDCESGADTVVFLGGEKALPDEAALWQYTYLVAGCVGEFWTELGEIVFGEGYYRPNTPEREMLLEKAKHYGQALQLVNILRDRNEDFSRGRSYFPLLSAEETAALEKTCAEKAHQWLVEGLFYTEQLANWRLRFATGLPALLGVRTLELLREHPDQFKVKVPRREVYGLMWQAILATCRKGGWADIAEKLK